jgi:MATE family multidrug resistance protein
MATLASFFSGRGQTLAVLRVNVLVTLVNIALDYAWIFGRLGFPRAGVFGAAAATITSQAVGSLVYLALMLAPEFRRRYATLSGWRFDRALFARLLRYGLPSGLHWSIEIFSFGLFLVIVGRIGTTELAATGLAFNLNGLVFVPMLGLGLGVSAIVGRHLGADRPDLAERSTWSAIGIALLYMTVCGAAYFLLPSWLLAPYRFGADAAAFAPVAALTTVLLRFVAIYSIFDMLNVICAAALRGAGDTSFAMWSSTFFSIVAMLLPAYVACIVYHAGVLVAWTAASAYVFCVGSLLLLRFRAGRWKTMRVIEPAPV